MKKKTDKQILDWLETIAAQPGNYNTLWFSNARDIGYTQGFISCGFMSHTAKGNSFRTALSKLITMQKNSGG